MVRNFWKQLRRICQILGLIIFLALFRLTDYGGTDTIPYAVNILFRIDPLVGVCVTLAARTFVGLLWPCLVMVAFTLVLGRFFCGWICPLGTLTDMAGHGFGPGKKNGAGSIPNLGFLKYVFLILVLISSLFSIQLLGFVDPFSLLVRGMAFGVDPLFNFLVTGFFDGIYRSGPAWLSDLTEPVYGVLKSFVLPHKQSFFALSSLSFFLLAGILALEIFGKRFWCRNLCPLGALFALISKAAILKRIPIKTCIGYCPRKITGFGFGLPVKPRPVDISRRQLVTAGLVGICLPVLSRTNALSKMQDNDIRPPGAMDEPDFLATCVRCGECMKVCITNGLQPLGFEKGLEPMFTPRLVPRLGYCEFNCTLCSQVCPTRAIEPLSREKKYAFVMGSAWFDKNSCLPYAEKKSCIVCEEHCPVHDKAIEFDEVKIVGPKGETTSIKLPRVIAERCIGCGICEYVCPVPGEAAIRVVGRGSRKNVVGGSGYS